MICLDNTDTLEAGASVNAVVDCTVHGLVGTTFTNLYSGQLSDTDPTVIYTAAAAISIVAVTMVNTHSAAVSVNLYLDPANGGNPRRMIPEDLSLGIGYSMHFDGQRCSVLDANGILMQGTGVSDTAWVNYFSTSTIGGWVTPAGWVYYKKIGKTVFVSYSITGTSNAAGTTFTLPVTFNMPGGMHLCFGRAVNNGGAAVASYVELTDGGSVVSFYSSLTGTGFTTSGTKTIQGQFFVEVD